MNAIYESLISFKRAGASAIVTYFADEIAKKLINFINYIHLNNKKTFSNIFLEQRNFKSVWNNKIFH